MHIIRQNEWIDKARECMLVQQRRKELENQEKILLIQLKELSEHQSSKGGGFVYTATERKGAIDYESIDVLKGINLEPYRKESTLTWKLTMELIP